MHQHFEVLSCIAVTREQIQCVTLHVFLMLLKDGVTNSLEAAGQM